VTFLKLAVILRPPYQQEAMISPLFLIHSSHVGSLPTNPMRQSPRSEADSSSVGQ
jgi:hypothetical protein